MPLISRNESYYLMDIEGQDIKSHYERFLPHLDERIRRLWLGNEALAKAWGGMEIVSKITINVCHLPPGASKWNKVEHRLFQSIGKETFTDK